MHVLVTADSLSGSWTYARELVTGLVTRGVRVTLVSVGEIPLPDQTAWMDHLHGLDYRPTAFRLEWMQEAEEDLPESSAYLLALVRELRPDVLHFNHFCYGNLPVDIPRVVMAHGDLITWRQAVHDRPSQPAYSLNCYRRNVVNGLMSADAVVAPSAWMLDRISACYGSPKRGEVIYPGRNPIFFNPYVSKDDCVLAIGRLVDASKQVFLLTQQSHPLPVCIVGAEHTVPMPRIPIRADVKLATEQTSVGMPALEAAFSRCAIIANDIPSYREIWGDAALYFRRNDAASLAENIRLLNQDRPMRRAYAELAYARARERFTTKRMIDQCLELYRSLITAKSIAA